ncbi:MAG: YbaN family protein [Spirochaetales bacterium]
MRKYLLLLIGTLSLSLGILGIFLPLLPTTPFLLLTAACYARSSERFYSWLMEHSIFGSYIRNYREGKGIPRSVKVGVLSLLWGTILYSAFFVVHLLGIRILLLGIAGSVTWHILSLPTRSKERSPK